MRHYVTLGKKFLFTSSPGDVISLA